MNELSTGDQKKYAYLGERLRVLHRGRGGRGDHCGGGAVLRVVAAAAHPARTEAGAIAAEKEDQEHFSLIASATS